MKRFNFNPAFLKNVRRIMKQVESRQQSLGNFGFFQTMENIQKATAFAEPIQKSIVQLKPLYDLMEQMAISIQPVIKDFTSVQSSITNNALNQLLKQNNEFYKAVNFQIFDTTSLLQFQETYNDLLSLEESQKLNELSFPSHSIQTIESLNKKDILTKQDLLAYITSMERIFTFIVGVIAIIAFFFPDDSKLTEIQDNLISINTENQKQFIELKNMIDESKASFHRNVYYEVTKKVNIREYPSSESNSTILDIAFPKEKLLLLNTTPYWIQIEYFNEKKNETIIGWTSKKYTKLLE